MQINKKVLIIDDNPAHRELLKIALQDVLPDVQVFEAQDPRTSMAMLSEQRYDMILLDYMLPGTDGLSFLEKTRELRQDTPLVMVTGSGSEDVAAKAFKLGVTEYIVKSGDLVERLSDLAREVLVNMEREEKTPSASLRAADSGIRLVEGLQSDITNVFKNKSSKEKIVIEFDSADEFNAFSRWVTGRQNVEIEKVQILERKYVIMVSIMPVSYDRIG